MGKWIQTPKWWCSRFNTLLLALGLLVLHRLLKRRADRSLGSAFFLILLAGSMFPNHLRFYFGEVHRGLGSGGNGRPGGRETLLGLEQELTVAYGLLVFLHLSLPLFRLAAGQAWGKIGDLRRRFLTPKEWRI